MYSFPKKPLKTFFVPNDAFCRKPILPKTRDMSVSLAILATHVNSAKSFFISSSFRDCCSIVCTC